MRFEGFLRAFMGFSVIKILVCVASAKETPVFPPFGSVLSFVTAVL